MPTNVNVLNASGTQQTIALPVPGVAGTPSADVASIQGVSGGTPIAVSPTGTQAVSAAALPLPAGAATEATLAALNAKVPGSGLASETTLAALSTKFSTLGQKIMTACVSVVLASDHGPIDVLTTALNALLTAIRDRLPATNGQKTSANSLAVVIASDQSSLPVASSFAAATFTPFSAAASVAGTVMLVAANANRRGLIVNAHPSINIWISLNGSNASTTNGLLIAAGSGAIALPQFARCTSEIRVLSESGTPTISGYEII